MSVTPHQPTLPLEGSFTEAEMNFLEESPSGLFPENQNSNFGYVIRKIFSDQMQTAVDQVETLYNEKFILTAEEFLHLWEQDYGLPVAPTGKTVAERRSIIESRISTGAFTRDRVADIIEKYLNATLGTTIAFTPDGVPIVAGGVPLYGEFTSGQSVYRVYEDIRNFTYTVWILNTITPDITGMQRELARITPSGIQFTIDNTKTNVLNYHRAIINKQPVAYFRLNGADATDESGYANGGSFPAGNPTAVGGPGLLHSAVQHDLAGAGDGAADFNGSSHYLSVPHAAQLNVGDQFSLEAWLNRDGATADAIVAKGVNGFEFQVAGTGELQLTKMGIAVLSTSAPLVLPGVTNHVVVTRQGPGSTRFFVNGVESPVFHSNTTLAIENTLSALEIARRHYPDSYFDGKIDEAAIYNYALTPEQILENYNTGINVA